MIKQHKKQYLLESNSRLLTSHISEKLGNHIIRAHSCWKEGCMGTKGRNKLLTPDTKCDGTE